MKSEGDELAHDSSNDEEEGGRSRFGLKGGSEDAEGDEQAYCESWMKLNAVRSSACPKAGTNPARCTFVLDAEKQLQSAPARLLSMSQDAIPTAVYWCRSHAARCFQCEDIAVFRGHLPSWFFV